jgi:hypothetical protein
MKNPKHIIIAISLLMAASAQAQSWGFTLGNGAGFFYDRSKSRSGGVTLITSRPVYYAAPQYYYREPVVYRRPCVERPRVVYHDHAAYIPRTPRTYYTSYEVSYPNYWRRYR